METIYSLNTFPMGFETFYADFSTLKMLTEFKYIPYGIWNRVEIEKLGMEIQV